MDKPYAPACDRNRDPILAVLRKYFADRTRVLEIGSGTGQHAVYFAKALPHLMWQTADVAEHLPGVRAWLADSELTNTPPPIQLDVNGAWPKDIYDAIFSANTLHIMSWPEVKTLFAYLPRVMTATARVIIYGPFNYDGSYTSPSNEAFDYSLRQRDPGMGIRNFEDVVALASTAGLQLLEDCAMPANNRALVWERTRA
jgi:cyclopropane fatty-acyl-phospholipid synthase-like methyltransferase